MESWQLLGLERERERGKGWTGGGGIKGRPAPLEKKVQIGACLEQAQTGARDPLLNAYFYPLEPLFQQGIPAKPFISGKAAFESKEGNRALFYFKIKNRPIF